MSAFTGDLKKMDCTKLLAKLEELAAERRASPHLSNDHHHGIRYHEIRDEIRRKCSKDCVISATQAAPVDYQVSCTAV